jgi:hypothetical protein
MVPVTFGTQEIVTFRAPGGRKFRFVVMITDVDELYCAIHDVPCCVMCIRDDHRHCQELRPILEVTQNAKSSTAIVHIERDLENIDAAFEKMKSDITNNITEIDRQKRKFLSDISDMRKSFNDHLDKIEKQTVEEMVSVEQNLQVQLKTSTTLVISFTPMKVWRSVAYFFTLFTCCRI